jgi:hypothetical protein
MTRLLSQFKKRRVIESRGVGFCVTNISGLEALAVRKRGEPPKAPKISIQVRPSSTGEIVSPCPLKHTL